MTLAAVVYSRPLLFASLPPRASARPSSPSRASRISSLSRPAPVSLNPIDHLPDEARLTFLARGFSAHDCLQRAAALSFEAIFAVIPMLAIGVSILKSLGVYANVDRTSLRLWLTHTVGVQHDAHLLTLEDGINQILDAVDAASLSSLGVVGGLAFLYAIGILFSSVERSLDTIFGTPETRPLRRRLINYAALLFALPMLVLAGSAPLAALASKIAESGPVGVLIHIGSAALASLGLTVVLRLTPNTRVRWRAALLGGTVGATLGYVALQAQVYAQVGVARYNLLYSGFAALPLLLLWVHVTWISVLLGAELAAFMNTPESYKRRVTAAYNHDVAKADES